MKLIYKIILIPVCLFAGSNHWYLNETGTESEFVNNSNIQFKLDVEDFYKKLIQAPLVSLAKNSAVILNFPTPAGDFIQFEIFESPVMPIKLADKYPMIKTFSGRGIENPNDRISVTLYHDKIKVLVLSGKGRIFIDKLKTGIQDYRVSFSEFDGDPVEYLTENCGLDDSIKIDDLNENNRDFPYCVGEDEPCFQIGNNLVTFRYAGILTAEANNGSADGTVAGGLAWIAAMVNQVNLVWVRDLSFRLEMIENSDILIYTDENPTPELFTAYNMNTELPRVLEHLTEVIGPGGYATSQSDLLWEYGAVFNTGYGGGLAYVPGSTSANLPSYAIHIHEIGHNLGSSHNCTSEGGWRCSFGGTAMCNRTNTLPGNSGDQYSSHTIDIAIRYQNLMFGSNNYDYQQGWIQEPTDNYIPVITVPESGFTIPKETPFVLEGTAIDGNADDQLTFSWEQNDASNISFSPPDFPTDQGPLFSSLDGKTDGNLRYFPDMASLTANSYSTGNIEALPFASREVNMRLLVRDNDLYSGALNYNNVQFFVDENAGPFRVTSQPEYAVWEVGSTQTITWNTADTDNPNTVNCSAVDILLAVNGSDDFDHVLALNVPNDGSHFIVVPELPTVENCRVMVKSSDNIFFDINNGSISVINNFSPDFGIDLSLVDLSISNESTITVEREITNIGEPGSILIYESIAEIDQNGEGYLSFDGVDDNVDLGSGILSGNGDFTISLWVRSTSTNKVIIQQRNGGFNGEYQIKFNGSGQINIWTYSDGYRWSATSSGIYNDNAWHHIAVIQDETIDGGRIYVDGIENAVNSGGIVNLNGGIHTYLGADMRDYVNYLTGDINDVNIFSDALTGSEISALFNNGFGFNTTYDHDNYYGSGSLIASFPMQAMQGETLFDISLNGHDGFLDGASWAGDLVPVPNWLSVQSENNWLNVGESETITMNINPTQLNINSDYTGRLLISSNSGVETVEVPIQLSITDDTLSGDLNLDGEVNIIDVILLVNYILASEYADIADLNSDEVLNILDVVQLVNIILEF